MYIFAIIKQIIVMSSKGIRIMMAFLALCLLMPTASAQTVVTKEAKKQAKTFKKEGWVVNEGEKDMEQQFADLQRYANDSLYIVESATQKSKAYHLALKSANEKAKGAIVRRLNTLIASETSLVQTNQQTGEDGVESQQAFNNRIKSISRETLSDAFPVLVMSRQLPDGTCEVQVHLAIAIPEK